MLASIAYHLLLGHCDPRKCPEEIDREKRRRVLPSTRSRAIEATDRHFMAGLPGFSAVRSELERVASDAYDAGILDEEGRIPVTVNALERASRGRAPASSR